MLGQTQHHEQVHITIGSNLVDLDVSGIEPGIYLLRLQLLDESIYRKIIIE
jgi:hypothetical protein